MLRRISQYSEPTAFDAGRDDKLKWPQMPDLMGAISFFLIVLAVWLWTVSLQGINLRAMDDTGLMSVLPFSTLLALFILIGSFCLALSRRPLPVPLLFLHVVVLIFLTYGITAIVQEVPRFAIGWKLAGIMDYIMKTGTVDGRIDAFFNWPGFFIFMAFILEAAGFSDPFGFMSWAPVMFNLLYLGPLWMLFRSATDDNRLVMLGLWFFYLANWIGQDYLAPQAFNYFIFLVVLAIILTWLRGPAWPAQALLERVRWRSPMATRILNKVDTFLIGEEKPVAASTPMQRAALVGIIVIAFITMAPSHQLTPLAMLAAISALVFFNRCSALTLPLLLGLLVATWVFYGAAPFMRGHFEQVAGPVGSVGSNIDANLTERFKGSPGHIFINYMRSGMSLAVWGMAFLGGLRRVQNGSRDWGLAILALTPFPLLGLQAYGGELLLRIYLFSVPFMAFFCATLFYPSFRAGTSWWSTLSLYAVSILMLISFMFTRFGNERMMYFTPAEVAAMEYIYEVAEPGSQLVAITGTLAWRYQDYRAYKYTTVPRIARENDLKQLAKIMRNSKYTISYLILTRSQHASGELFIGWPPGTWDLFKQSMLTSKEFSLLYANEDAEVYVLNEHCRELNLAFCSDQ